MAINISNPQSGIIVIEQDQVAPKYYFGPAGAAGKWYVSGKDYDNVYNQILLIIGGDSYQLAWTDTTVSGNIPSSLQDLNDKLVQLFSSL
jgi:hypothetical protein